MVNTAEFTNRLKKILEHHQLTASQFADQVGVQRSSISHILSGRNKPSLDFVLKVTHAFTDVDIYWLLNGKGTFPKESKKEAATPPPQTQLFSSSETSASNSSSKQISRIVVFYTDGTFDEYKK
jgi:transcriptional regulator with XRE-family HTH domain